MTQFLPPAVNVGDSQSLHLEGNANSEATSLLAADINTVSKAMWSDLDPALWRSILNILYTIGSVVHIS